MKSVKLIGWASMFLLLFLVGCRDDQFIDTTGNDNPIPSVLVNTDVTVLVMDEGGNLLETASVEINDQTQMTNELGFVTYENENMNSNGQTISIAKAGYFEVQKVIYPTTARKSISVQLMEKTLTGSISATAGGSVTTTDGASVIFDANSIKYETGGTYNGQVNVYARWLNPEDENMPLTMPGNLRALNSDEDQVQLATFGMMAVELETPSGEKLNIADGESATLEFPLPPSTLSKAPNTIPLWSYNDQNGFWIEEGTASIQGDKYVGQVSHFSYWNCDAPFPLVNFEATIVDDNGNPLEGVATRMVVVSSGLVGYGNTDANGVASGKIPKYEELIFKVLDDCNETILEIPIGPFSMDVVYTPDIVVDPASTELVEVIGTLVDCDGNPVVDGAAIINLQYNHYVYVEDDGKFAKSFIFCDGNYDGTIKGYDNDAQLVSETVSFTVDPANPVFDIGNVEVCETATEFVSIDTDYPYDRTYLLYGAFISPNGIQINATTGDSTNLNIYMPDYAEGTYTDPGIEMWSYDIEEELSISIDYQSGNERILTITTNDGAGGLLEGTLESDFTHSDNSGNTVSAPGVIEFKVLLE